MKERETSKLYNSITNVDNQFVEEAQRNTNKKKNGWLKWGAMAACICLVVVAVTTFPSILKPQEGADEGGGTPITSDPNHSISEIIPILLAQQEVVEEIKSDIIDQDIQSWTEIPNSTLNFAYVIPIYSTANMTENSSTILETLLFDNQYKIPAISNGECIGTFTIVQHEGKWVIGIYESGFDIEAEIKTNEDSATCFISVSQLQECGFLTITDTDEEYVPISGFGASDIMSGEQLLEKIKETVQHSHNDAEG